MLNTLGSPKHLKHAIEGESLLNDGTAYVFFLMAMSMIVAENDPTQPYTYGDAALSFVKLAGGGVVWGMVFGWVTYRWCKLSRHASVIDITVLLLNVYMVFYLGEHVLHVSGVLSTVTFGIYLSKKAPYAMNHHVRHNVHGETTAHCLLTALPLPSTVRRRPIVLSLPCRCPRP